MTQNKTENTQIPAFKLASTGMDLSKEEPRMVDIAYELDITIKSQIEVMYECLYQARKTGELKAALDGVITMLYALPTQLDNLTEAFTEAKRRHRYPGVAEAGGEVQS